jgi:NAD(P)-dependent dehydrogenase (short-subunit alcohol dehydrogenase family)
MMVAIPAMTDPLFDLHGRIILVAGGAGGLGTPLAKGFAQRGAKVLIGDVDGGLAAKVAKDIGDSARATALDVTNAASCDAAVKLAVSTWGRLDGLLNASGTYRVGRVLDELDDDAWDRTLEVNVTGAFRLARAAGRTMVEQHAGSIVTLASVSSVVANPRYAAYAASKAAAAHLTRVLAVEWSGFGVRVNAIGPAVIPTAMTQQIIDNEKNRAAALARIPMGRFGTPDDLIGAAVFLLSPASCFVTGQTLFVDGGRTIS